MKHIYIAHKHIKKCMTKPHFQVFMVSFSICLLFFFVISKTSGSNIPPRVMAAFDPILSIQNTENKSVKTVKDDYSILNDIFSNTKKYEVIVKNGDTLASILSNINVDYSEVLEVSKAIRPYFNLSDLRPNNDKLIIRVNPISGSDKKNELYSLKIQKSPIHKIISKKTNDGFKAFEEKSDITAELVRGEGIILKGSSLSSIAIEQDIPYNIVDRFYEIFSFDVDFERDIYPGDKFEIMYEQLYSEEGEYLGTGDVIYASLSLQSRSKNFTLFRYENEKGTVAYYDENGKGASKTLKKSPINGARVSSKYGMRKHPILAYSKAHKGIDFAAPTGTPIPASGSGKVVSRGWKGGYGHYIKIRHNGTYSTAYGHLSRYKSDVKVGSIVKQGQIIGYVGNTGMSTGPHLHYEIIKDGVHVNPFTVKLPSIKSLSKKEMTNFVSVKDKIKVQFAVLDKNFSQFANLIDINSIEADSK